MHAENNLDQVNAGNPDATETHLAAPGSNFDHLNLDQLSPTNDICQEEMQPQTQAHPMENIAPHGVSEDPEQARLYENSQSVEDTCLKNDLFSPEGQDDFSFALKAHETLDNSEEGKQKVCLDSHDMARSAESEGDQEVSLDSLNTSASAESEGGDQELSLGSLNTSGSADLSSMSVKRRESRDLSFHRFKDKRSSFRSSYTEDEFRPAFSVEDFKRLSSVSISACQRLSTTFSLSSASGDSFSRSMESVIEGTEASEGDTRRTASLGHGLNEWPSKFLMVTALLYTVEPRNTGSQGTNKFHLLLADFCYWEYRKF